MHLGQAVKQGATGFSLGSVIVACLGSAILAGWFFKSKVGQAYQLFGMGTFMFPEYELRTLPGSK